ncbi:MAG: transcriptional regulator with XRE-family HTH domain [Flavobacteriales bacterium]|jgi:transcriptional regulator with XRE-family HTH domain
MVESLMNNIRVLRELKGFTQEYLSDSIGLSRASYSQIENGRTRLTAEQLLKIAEILEMDVQQIIDFEKPLFYKQSDEKKQVKETDQPYEDNDQLHILKELVNMQREVIQNLKKEIDQLKTAQTDQKIFK